MAEVRSRMRMRVILVFYKSEEWKNSNLAKKKESNSVSPKLKKSHSPEISDTSIPRKHLHSTTDINSSTLLPVILNIARQKMRASGEVLPLIQNLKASCILKIEWVRSWIPKVRTKIHYLIHPTLKRGPSTWIQKSKQNYCNLKKKSNVDSHSANKINSMFSQEPNYQKCVDLRRSYPRRLSIFRNKVLHSLSLKKDLLGSRKKWFKRCSSKAWDMMDREWNHPLFQRLILQRSFRVWANKEQLFQLAHRVAHPHSGIRLQL